MSEIPTPQVIAERLANNPHGSNCPAVVFLVRDAKAPWRYVTDDARCNCGHAEALARIAAELEGGK